MIHDIKGLAGNLAALQLQAAAGEMEKLVKSANKEHPPLSESLTQAFETFEARMKEALRSARGLASPTDPQGPVSSLESPGDLPPELAGEAAKRLRSAAEMGDVTELTAIAQEMAIRSKAFGPYESRIAQLTDDFNFEGILGLAEDLEKMQG
jgi:HPt (histidine-containing phosphotransfer) domain-containing protein